MRAQLDAANKEAFENWDDPVWRRSMAEALTQTIYRGFEHESLLSLLTQVENVPFDGRSFVKEVRGLRAFWVARGGYIEASDMRAQVFEIPRDTIGFHVYEFEDKIRTNFGETQSNLVDLGVQRLDAEVNRRLLALFQAAIPNGSLQYVPSSGVTLPILNSALRQVRDESREWGVTILGRATMTDQIVDLVTGGGVNNGFLPQTNEDLLARGILGTYRGATIVTLRNWKDDEDIPFWPANEAYVIGRDASKFAFFGGLLSKEYVENDQWYWHFLARRDAGGVIHRPERVRRLIDTSQAAGLVPQRS
jgi:hypothetical protein